MSSISASLQTKSPLTARVGDGEYFVIDQFVMVRVSPNMGSTEIDVNIEGRKITHSSVAEGEMVGPYVLDGSDGTAEIRPTGGNVTVHGWSYE